MEKRHGSETRREGYGRTIEGETVAGRTGRLMNGDPGAEGPTREARPDPDAILSTIADERRRAILRTLDRNDDTVSELDAIVDDVHDETRRGDAMTADERQRIQIRMSHVDLPKLAAVGLIEYDADAKQVRSVEGAFTRQLRSVVDEYEEETRNG